MFASRYAWIAAIRSGTDLKAPRRMALPIRARNHRSISRPWGAGSSVAACSGVSGEPVEVSLDAGDDA